MARPVKCRNIVSQPGAYYFKPRGIPLCVLEEIYLAADEFQALKYYDMDGRSQTEAAELMGISRQTFGNIIASARRKIADALANGKALKIEKYKEKNEDRLLNSAYQLKKIMEWNQPFTDISVVRLCLPYMILQTAKPYFTIMEIYITNTENAIR